MTDTGQIAVNLGTILPDPTSYAVNNNSHTHHHSIPPKHLSTNTNNNTNNSNNNTNNGPHKEEHDGSNPPSPPITIMGYPWQTVLSMLLTAVGIVLYFVTQVSTTIC